jgi:hypothetical protein
MESRYLLQYSEVFDFPVSLLGTWVFQDSGYLNLTQLKNLAVYRHNLCMADFNLEVWVFPSCHKGRLSMVWKKNLLHDGWWSGSSNKGICLANVRPWAQIPVRPKKKKTLLHKIGKRSLHLSIGDWKVPYSFERERDFCVLIKNYFQYISENQNIVCYYMYSTKKLEK